MPHPQMFDDDDPLVARLRAICLALPGATERISFGRPTYRHTKAFAAYGGHRKGDMSRDLRALIVLPDPGEEAALRADERFFVPAYWGAAGWLGLDLAAGEPDWAEVRELIVDSFRVAAPARLLARLQEPGQG